jgi:hypothetical protein
MKRLVSTLLAVLACSVFAVAVAAPRPPASTQVGQTTTTVSGTLTAKGNKFYLSDEASGSTVEVRGAGLQKYVGSKITATGQMTPSPAGTPGILTASQVSRKAAVVAKAAAPGVKAGISKVAVVALAGGATAATVGSLYATDVIGGQEDSVSRK